MMPILQKHEIINRLARGETQISISADTGIPRSTIQSIKSNNKKIVEEQATKLLKYLPDIVESVAADLQVEKKISTKIGTEFETYEPKDLIALKKVYNKSLDNVLRSVGIYPSQSPSIVFNNNDNRIQVNNQLHPVITKIMSTAMLDSIDSIDIDESDS